MGLEMGILNIQHGHAHDYLVYLGPVYLFAQASSTCLPRPGLPAFNTHASSKRGGRTSGRAETSSKTCVDFVIYGVPRPRDYHHQILFEKLVWMNQFSA